MRYIPSIFVSDGSVYKTFSNSPSIYLGDPVNILSLFVAKDVEELAVINPSDNHSENDILDFVQSISSHCFVPLAYGGGIRSFSIANQVLQSGVERVIFNSSSMLYDFTHLALTASKYGSQATSVMIEVTNTFSSPDSITHCCHSIINLRDYITRAINAGVGELIFFARDRDGQNCGLSLSLAQFASVYAKKLPVLLSGGFSTYRQAAYLGKEYGLSGCLVGYQFAFISNSHRSILINTSDSQGIDL